MLHYRKHPLVRQALAIGWWQLVTKGAAFFGSVWATRCLGPYKLGISSMIIAVMGQVWFLATPFLDVLLTRRYKLETDQTAREELISATFTWRFYVTSILG